MLILENFVEAMIHGKARSTWASWDIDTTFSLYRNGWRSAVRPGKLEVSMWDNNIAAIQPIGPVAEIFGSEVPTAWVSANRRTWEVKAALRWTLRNGYIAADYAGISESFGKEYEDTYRILWLAWLRRGRIRIRIQPLALNGDILSYVAYHAPETEFYFATLGRMRWGWGVSAAGYRRKFQEICPEYAAQVAASMIASGGRRL